jgi:hypothetical protein
MKLGLPNYAVNITIGNSYIKLNNNKINSLQRHGIAQNYRNLHNVVQRLSQRNLKMSNHLSVKENNDSNNTWRHVHDLSTYKTSFI